MAPDASGAAGAFHGSRSASRGAVAWYGHVSAARCRRQPSPPQSMAVHGRLQGRYAARTSTVHGRCISRPAMAAAAAV